MLRGSSFHTKRCSSCDFDHDLHDLARESVTGPSGGQTNVLYVKRGVECCVKTHTRSA